MNTESSYDWRNEQWPVPVNAVASKVTTRGGQTVSLAAGIRYWLDSPDNGPGGVGFRLNAVPPSSERVRATAKKGTDFDVVILNDR